MFVIWMKSDVGAEYMTAKLVRDSEGSAFAESNKGRGALAVLSPKRCPLVPVSILC